MRRKWTWGLPRPDPGPRSQKGWGYRCCNCPAPTQGLPLLQGSEARFLFCGPRPHSLSQTHPGPSPGELCVASALVLRPI